MIDADPGAEGTHPQGGSAPVVHLHIGTMKTGTSYVQGLLERDRESLAAEGMLVVADPGRAVHDVLDLRGPKSLGDITGAWSQLVADVRAWSGDRVVLSMEFLGLATAPQVRDIVASLAPSPVRVVITARDLGRTIPSAWQQTTKNQQLATWPEFLEAIADPEPSRSRAGRQFWRHHDVAAIAKRWVDVVGPDSVTIVTVPPTGAPPEELWSRVCAAIEIDPAQHVPGGDGRRNASLGHAEAELLRRLNVALDGRLPQPEYRRLVTGLISRRFLRRGRTVSAAPVVPAAVQHWAADRSDRAVAELGQLGLRVIGDLDELRTVVTPPVDEESSSDEAVTAIAVHVAAGLLATMAEDAGGGEVSAPAGARATRPLSPGKKAGKNAGKGARAARGR